MQDPFWKRRNEWRNEVFMSRKLSFRTMRFLYNNGHYRFEAPPVCTYRWGEFSWLRFINSCDGWILPY